MKRPALVTLFGGGAAGQSPGDYFVGPQLGGPRLTPIELGRDPTASERALGKVPQPAPQLYRIQDLFPLNSDCDSEGPAQCEGHGRED
jgi:hypothetical protein